METPSVSQAFGSARATINCGILTIIESTYSDKSLALLFGVLAVQFPRLVDKVQFRFPSFARNV
jgi:hypothetical protein